MDPFRPVILLITTELLSNAIMASSGPVVLCPEGHRRRVDIVVADSSPVRSFTGPTHNTPAGRGLLLVAALSEK